jgi:hypothetical protein
MLTEALSPILPPDLERDIYELLRTLYDKNLMVTTAESCTGGLLGSILTDVDGFGRVFERGFVAYTELAKHEMLGVPMATLQTDGAVSEATAAAMAEGALARSKPTLPLRSRDLPDREGPAIGRDWSIWRRCAGDGNPSDAERNSGPSAGARSGLPRYGL